MWAVPSGPPECPGCGGAAAGVHQHVAPASRDVRCGGQEVRLCVLKRRLECGNPECPVKTFTERAPLPPRCRVTPRLKDQAASEVTDRGVTSAEAARHAGASLLLFRRHAPDCRIVISYRHPQSARHAEPREAGMAAPMPRPTTWELPTPG